jgi:adenosylcobinamide-GDP ribazoletransferase
MVTGLQVGATWWRGLATMLVGAAVAYGVVRLAVRRLGGITGDVLGAVVELTLVALLLTAAA